MQIGTIFKMILRRNEKKSLGNDVAVVGYVDCSLRKTSQYPSHHHFNECRALIVETKLLVIECSHLLLNSRSKVSRSEFISPKRLIFQDKPANLIRVLPLISDNKSGFILNHLQRR